jgi:hypothetical protein
MRLHDDFAGLAALLIVLTSCTVSNFYVAGVPTFGRIQDVSVADIEAAISAYKQSLAVPEPVGPAEVISHDEIRIYQDSECRNFTSMVRVKGKWQLGSVVLVHPRY